MDDEHLSIEELARRVRELTARVYALEQRSRLELGGAQFPRGPAHPPQQIPACADRPPGDTQSVVQTQPTSVANARGLETVIGSQWLNRIGIIAVLIGVAYFLNYAFENEWIAPVGRIVIGLLAGIAVLIGSEVFRHRGYRVFSFSLKAIGLGVLYLSLWAAFHVYELISKALAFAGMVAVTSATLWLSLRETAEVLALFALVGGFLTPVLLFNGRNDGLALFVYLTILDMAGLFLARMKQWHSLLLLSVISTGFLFFAWYGRFYTQQQLALTLTFATLFFLIFALGVVSASGPSGSTGSALPFVVALLNALIYFSQVYEPLGKLGPAEKAWCALGLTAFYFWLAWQFRGRPEAPASRKVLALHLTLAVAFLAVAIAIEFSSTWITLFWFVEAGILMGLGFAYGPSLLRWQALAVIAVTILKVFTYDVWRLELAYRVVSFIALGVFLLCISFFYQRAWKQISTSHPD